MANRPVPFEDPFWCDSTNYQLPNFTKYHIAFQQKVRQFVDEEIIPFVGDWDEAHEFPKDLWTRAYQRGIYGARWPKEYGGTPPEGGWDYYMDIILNDELARCGSGGLVACLFSCGIGLPPVLAVGSNALKRRIAPAVIRGEKMMALAITEPTAGSDVANIRTTARREGDYFIVNGMKKFITNGINADYVTVAVRTGKTGMKGISLLLIEKGMPGFRTKRMKTQGWWASNTALLIFEDVKVPVSNLIGQENAGFMAIMLNFNHERFSLAVTSNRYARLCLSESIKYARVRKTFGKPLIQHQVIRHKIAEMARRVEATQALLMHLTNQLNLGVNNNAIASLCSMAKVQATRTYEFCAREASQVFGGNSYLRTGKGAIVERLYREVRVNAIGGGSEEIMNDLAMKLAKI